MTSQEAGLVKYGVSPARYDETLFCHDKVRYVGDEIAAVAAVDLETAMEALSLIKVDYEELPAGPIPGEAMAEGAPLVHDEFQRNIGAEVHQEFGDVEAALAQCHLVRTDTFGTDGKTRPSSSPRRAWPNTTSREPDASPPPNAPLCAADHRHGDRGSPSGKCG